MNCPITWSLFRLLNTSHHIPLHLPGERKQRVSVPAFTLIELLVVIVIIGILAAITLSAISRVRSHARAAKCVSNLRQWCIAIPMFAADNGGKLPQTDWDNSPEQETLAHLAPYVGSGNWTNSKRREYGTHTFGCSEYKRTYTTANHTWGYGFNTPMNKMKLNVFSQPSRQVWVMDTAASQRWVDLGTLTGSAAKRNTLLRAFPRPHMGKLGVGFLDGHAQLRTLPSLTWDMFVRDTSAEKSTSIPNPWNGTPIVTPEEEAKNEAIALAY